MLPSMYLTSENVITSGGNPIAVAQLVSPLYVWSKGHVRKWYYRRFIVSVRYANYWFCRRDMVCLNAILFEERKSCIPTISSYQCCFCQRYRSQWILVNSKCCASSFINIHESFKGRKFENAYYSSWFSHYFQLRDLRNKRSHQFHKTNGVFCSGLSVLLTSFFFFFLSFFFFGGGGNGVVSWCLNHPDHRV